MIRMTHGKWVKELALARGRYEYGCVVDGKGVEGEWVFTRGLPEMCRKFSAE